MSVTRESNRTSPPAVSIAARIAEMMPGNLLVPMSKIAMPICASEKCELVASCVTGGSVWRRSSYLLDRLETPIASELVTITDDPLIATTSGEAGGH